MDIEIAPAISRLFERTLDKVPLAVAKEFAVELVSRYFCCGVKITGDRAGELDGASNALKDANSLAQRGEFFRCNNK